MKTFLILCACSKTLEEFDAWYFHQLMNVQNPRPAKLYIESGEAGFGRKERY